MSWFTNRPIHPHAVWHWLPTNMICPLCGRHSTTRGYRRHLHHCCSRHGMTFDDYLRDYWNVLFQPFHALVAKTYSLMDFHEQAFGWQWAIDPLASDQPHFLYPDSWQELPANVQWGYREIHPFTRKPSYFMTLRTERQVRRPETYCLGAGPRFQFCHFRIHYRGQGTLAVRLKRDNRLLCIDVDSTDVGQVRRACQVIRELGLQPHVEYSGKKGYHLWVFFDQVVSESRLKDLGQRIVQAAKLDYDLVYPLNQKLLKLPLGIHRATGNLAGFVNTDSMTVFDGKEQVDYFLGIQQQPFPVQVLETSFHPAIISGCSTTIDDHPPSRSLSKRVNSVTTSSQQTQRQVWHSPDVLLNEGTKLPQGRHHTLFLLSIHLKDHHHCDQTETTKRLREWSLKVHSTRSIEVRLADVDITVKNVFDKNLVCYGIKNEVLNEEEKKHIEIGVGSHYTVIGAFGSEVRKEDHTKSRRTILKMAWFMASVAKANQGVARLSNRFIAEQCGLSKRTVDRWLGFLVEDPETTDALDDDLVLAAAVDKRPRLKGCLFDRLHRGRLGDPSLFVLKPAVAAALGWPVIHPWKPGLT
jgi:hypothetical protein